MNYWHTFLEHSHSVVNIEQLHDVLQAVTSGCYAIISAFQHYQPVVTNLKNTRLLQRQLRAANYEIIPISGVWHSHEKEISFLVQPPATIVCTQFKQLLAGFARQFQQDAFIFGTAAQTSVVYSNGIEQPLRNKLKIKAK